LRRDRKSKKVKWRTVSVPRGLADDSGDHRRVRVLAQPGSLHPEAALEKLKRERQSPGRVVEEPIMAFSPEELER